MFRSTLVIFMSRKRRDTVLIVNVECERIMILERAYTESFVRPINV